MRVLLAFMLFNVANGKDPCPKAFYCKIGTCIMPELFCDGNNDCPNGSDEIHVIAGVSYGNFIPCPQYWDSQRPYQSCLLPVRQSDKKEMFCIEDPSCSSGFQCRNEKCIEPHHFCNGHDSCGDGSDEILVSGNPNASNFIPCRQRYDYNPTSILVCHLPVNQSIKKDKLCKIDVNCSSGFYCRNGKCIKPDDFCDGSNDCGDSSDEMRVTKNYSVSNFIPCRQNFDRIPENPTLNCLLPISQYSKKNLLCKIDANCSSGFQCQNGDCIESHRFCDASIDCGDGSDEILVSEKVNASNFIPCRRIYDYFSSPIHTCRLPMNQSSKKNKLCKIDSCSTSGFLCDNGKCIRRSRFCNNKNDCGDGSDEQKQYSDRDCEFVSGSSKCLLPDQFICNQKTECKNGIDECLCTGGSAKTFLDDKCFRCLSKPRVIVPVKKLCDGNIDCPDLSDECLCDVKTRPQICNKIQWENESSIELIPRAKIFCNANKTESLLALENLCDSGCEVIQDLSCNIRTNDSERYFCKGINAYVPKCDRKIDCTTRVDEEECKCDGQKPKICGEITAKYMNSNGYRLNDGSSIYAISICDDMIFRPSRSDEFNCPGWFDCNDTTREVFRVLPNQVCDAVKDCPDGSDEGVCPPFKCNDGGTVAYLEQRQVCDGTLNCAEGSDECEEHCIESAFSDTKKMIKNSGVETIVWIISLTALIGNAIVIGFTIRDLACNSRRQNESQKKDKLTKMMILNLSISDFLVGVYTLVIAIVNSVQRGSYCLIDHSWRSSSTCAAIGAILLIGSQNSVFTMLLITIFRVRATSKIIYEPSYKKYFMAIVTTWIISIALAGIPEIPFLEDYFVDSIWYENNRLFSIIDRDRVYDMPDWLLMINGLSNRTEPIRNLHTWATLEKLIGEMNPNFTVGRKYGFYSTHTVCLPTFFPNRKTDTAWWYSFLLIFVNMVAFLAMLGGYLKIYKSATRENPAVTEDARVRRARRMQVRITRIIITDALCWMPVCIMGFIQLAGVDIPPDAYLPVALMILPVNSSLNPFFYSSVPDLIWDKIKLAVGHMCGRVRGIRDRNRRNRQERKDSLIRTDRRGRVPEEIEMHEIKCE